MLQSIVLALFGAAITYGANAAWDWWQKKQGLKAQIESVGLKQRERENLESDAATREILQKQQDASKQTGPVTSKDFE